MCIESWTADDEKALLELQRRRQEVMNKRRNVLQIVIDEHLSIRGADIDTVVDELIMHADAITEALKPFTRKEGVRVKNVEVSSDQS